MGNEGQMAKNYFKVQWPVKNVFNLMGRFYGQCSIEIIGLHKNCLGM